MEATDPVAARLVGVALKAGAKDADVIRAAAEVLDRAGIPRRTEVGIDEAQVRRDIAERLAALDVPTAELEPAADDESPGEESPAEDDAPLADADTPDPPSTPSTDNPTEEP